MSWIEVADWLGMACLVVGSLLCLAASIGILRMPDFLSRMHPATKPQVLGMLLVLLAVALRLRPGWEITVLVLVGVFQMLTVPASGQMLSRAYHRREAADNDLDIDPHRKENL